MSGIQNPSAAPGPGAFYALQMSLHKDMGGAHAGRVHTLLLTTKDRRPGYFAAFVLDPDDNHIEAA
jgi:hypothetical protein